MRAGTAASDANSPWTGATSQALKYEFDCDNDGTYEVTAQTANTTTCTATDGPGTRTIGVRARYAF